MNKNNKPKYTKKDQKLVANILSHFMCTQNMDDVVKTYQELLREYDLMDDPFTGFPVTPEEYYTLKLEYERQLMIDKYGHCDGLE